MMTYFSIMSSKQDMSLLTRADVDLKLQTPKSVTEGGYIGIIYTCIHHMMLILVASGVINTWAL